MAATPVSTVTGAISGVDTDMITVAAAGIGIGATLLVLRRGWTLVKSYVKG